MLTWPSKDPQDVADYTNSWSLDGDTIAASVFNFVVQVGLVKDSESFTGNVAKIWLSGGTSGQVAVLVNHITTTGGRQFDSEPIYLPVAETYAAPPTGYVIPTAAQLLAIFPEFASVGNVDFWISRGARNVDQTWTEGDYSYAIMLYAAHLMSLNGGGTTGTASIANAAYRSIRSGQLSLTRYAKGEQGGDDGSLLGSTRYGRLFLELLSMNKTGIKVIAGDCGPVSGYAKDWPLWWV